VATARLNVTAKTAGTPRFSIVVPAYQAASTLGETLDAILAQTFEDWECIVVDDGSTDDTRTIATAYADRDPRIRVVHQDNQGTGGAYNAGVRSARGEFVAICSADDILLPGHLSAMSAFIDAEDGYEIYSSNGYFWSPGVSKELAYGPGERESIASFDLPNVIHKCFFSVGAAYRRELFGAVGGYRLGVYGEDYDFWLRAMAAGARQRYLPEPLALHRVSATQKSAQLEKVYQGDIRLLTDLRRDFTLSPEINGAIEQAIRDRERLVTKIHPLWRFIPHPFRSAAKRVVVGLVGRDRAWRLARAMTGLRDRFARGRSRS
jgi:glycosyltransferase involved in cell wall biosynthesis